MVYKTNVEVVQNDYGYNLNMRLQDVDGNAIDLTNVGTLNFHASVLGAAALKVDGTCSVVGGTVGAPLGSARYLVGSADFTEADKTYQVEVECSWGTKVVTGRGLTVYVRGELP